MTDEYGKMAVQEKILEIFLEIKRICDNNQIDYYICCGTCLGAVRHGGFIPWDDDLDILMTRDDYKKFKECCKQELRETFFLQDIYTEKNYPLVFPKVRNSNTAFIEKAFDKIDMNHGIYVDIFFNDYMSDNKILCAIQKALFIISNVLVGDFSINNKYKNFLVQFARKALRILHLKKPVYTFLIFCATHMASPKSKYMSHSMGKFSYAENTMPTEYFGKPSEILFEGVPVKTVAKVHEYLTVAFGDYMTPPPEEQRLSACHATIVDTDKSYTEILNNSNKAVR